MSEPQLTDDIIKHALQIQRLSAGEQQRLKPLMDQLADDLRGLLESGNLSEAGKREINALIKQAEDVIAGAYADAAQIVDAQELAKVVAEKTQTILISALPGAAVQMPTAHVLARLASDVMIQGSPASAYWAKQSDDTSFRFAAQVRQGVANGEPTAKIVQRIVGKRGEPGVMDVSRRHAAGLINTSIAAIADDARLASFRANSDIIKGVRRITALDGHVCLVCAAYGEETDGWDLEGKPLGKTKLPYRGGPFHFNDRCTTVPITKSFKDLGIDLPDLKPTTRASSAGQVDAEWTLEDFLRREGKAKTDEVLGPGRAELFLAGKLTIRDLVSGTGRPLTLEQLRKQAGE